MKMIINKKYERIIYQLLISVAILSFVLLMIFFPVQYFVIYIFMSSPFVGLANLFQSYCRTKRKNYYYGNVEYKLRIRRESDFEYQHRVEKHIRNICAKHNMSLRGENAIRLFDENERKHFSSFCVVEGDGFLTMEIHIKGGNKYIRLLNETNVDPSQLTWDNLYIIYSEHAIRVYVNTLERINVVEKYAQYRNAFEPTYHTPIDKAGIWLKKHIERICYYLSPYVDIIMNFLKAKWRYVVALLIAYILERFFYYILRSDYYSISLLILLVSGLLYFCCRNSREKTAERNLLYKLARVLLSITAIQFLVVIGIKCRINYLEEELKVRTNKSLREKYCYTDKNKYKEYSKVPLLISIQCKETFSGGHLGGFRLGTYINDSIYRIHFGQTIEKEILYNYGDTLLLGAYAEETDKIPAYSERYIKTVPIRSDLVDGLSMRNEIVLTENRGRYAGTSIGFEFEYQIQLKYPDEPYKYDTSNITISRDSIIKYFFNGHY